MKVLFKQAFKSFYSNKIFVWILMIIILITGTTFTLFNSASNSFHNSYDKAIAEGKVHDYIVHPKFSPKGSFKLKATKKNAIAGNVDYEITVDTSVSDYAGSDFKNYIDLQWIGGVLAVVSASTDAEAKKLANDKISQLSAFINAKITKQANEKFTEDIRSAYGNFLESRFIDSISVQPNSQDKPTVKVVHYNYDKNIHDDVNKMVIYDGTSNFSPSLTDAELKQELDFRAQTQWNVSATYTVNTEKGYRYTAQDAAANVISVTDPSSYEAIVSPSYASTNNKVAVTLKRARELYALFDDLHANKDQIELNKSHIIWVDNTPFIITGIGTTPDFSFPIIDNKHPSPNTQNEAIVFVNNRGFERVTDAFRTNPKENYISLKFHNNVTQEQKAVILTSIREKAQREMTWTENLQGSIVVGARETNDRLSLTQERLVFLDKLDNTLSTISWVLTILLIVFVAALVILIFKAITAANRKKMATLMALGYSKHKIATSISLTTSLMVVFPTILGYLIGFGLQYALIGVFDKFWTIPTYGSSFSWITLIAIAVAPVFLTALLIYLLVFGELSYKLTDMLNNRVAFGTKIIPTLLRPFQFAGIKTKYAISLMFSNIMKLAIVSLSASLAMTTLVVGIATLGKANSAYASTIGFTNYSFAVDLYTPTVEGGAYKSVKYNQINSLPHTETYSTSSTIDLDKPHWHIPSVNDGKIGNLLGVDFTSLKNHIATLDGTALPTGGTYNKGDWFVKKTSSGEYEDIYVYNGMRFEVLEDSKKIFTYLKNKLQTKALLDFPVAPNVYPWDTAKKLMPDNQKNIADNNFEEMTQTLPSTFPVGANASPYSDKWGSDSTTRVNVLSNIIASSKIKPYIISYDTVVIDDEDEKYTYINAINKNSGSGEVLHITGFQENTKYFNVSSSQINSLKNFNKPNVTPILINKYIEEDKKWSVGTQINLDVSNNVNRKHISSNADKTYEKTFEIVGIVNTYDSKGCFTLQKWANKAIDLNSTTMGSNEEYFNGIFTKNKEPSILSNLPLYSPSGLYIGSDTITTQWEPVVEAAISSGFVKNNFVNNLATFKQKYSSTPYVASLNNVDWKEIDKYTFENVSNLSENIINIVQIIVVTLSILFAVIIASLLINSNKRKIATLWTLGYRKPEIIKIFLSNFIVPLIIAICVAIPISITIIIGLKIFVMNFGSILIPFSLSWYAPIAAIGILSLVFTSSTILSVMSLRGDHALQAFKGE